MKVDSFSEDARHESARSKTRSTRRNTPVLPSAEEQTQQRSVPLLQARQEPKSPGGTIRWLPKDYKQALDALQRLTCLTLAIWAFTQTRNLLEFTGIMTVGYIGPGGAKEMLIRVLKSVLTEGK